MSASEATELTGAKNVRLFATEKALLVFCDLSKSFGPSTSGKSIVIASSSGNRPLGKSNAFLGLNLFTKNLEKMNITETGIASLRTEAFTEVNDGLSWRIEADNKTLCMRVCFADIKERPASSGKSVLIATSGGNKVVGNTGIMCGFNVYRSTQDTFVPSALSETMEVGHTVKLGDTATFEGGFTVHFISATAVEASVRVTNETLRSTKVVSLPKDVHLDNGTTLVMHVGLPVAKRGRSASPDTEDEHGHNCALSCQKEETPEETLIVKATFDPTKVSGRTASAKSFSVSSSSGFQVLYDAARRPACRANFTAYRPAPALTDAAIQSCVSDIISQQPDDMVETMTLKTLMRAVLDTFQLQDNHKELVRKAVEQAALNAMVRIRSQGSQSSNE